MQSKHRLAKLFCLPSEEVIFEDFGCACNDGFLKHGRMFVTENHICFYSTALSRKTKLVIPTSDITSVKKETSYGFRNNSIEIVLSSQSQLPKKSYLFTSFKNREAVFSLINGVWKGEYVGGGSAGESEGEGEDNVSESEISNDSLVVEQSDVEILNPTQNSEEKRELLRCIVPVSVDSFFEKFLGDNAVFSYTNHMEQNLSTDITLTKWLLNEALSCSSREANLVIKLTGVPLRDTSRLQKIQTYQKEGETLVVCSTTKVFDVPYSAYFTTEERMEISPVEGTPDKSLLICKGWVNFNKNTIMKRMITQRNEQGLKEDYDCWIGRITKIIKKQQQQQEESQTSNTTGGNQAGSQDHLEQVLTKDQLNSMKQKKQPTQVQSSGSESRRIQIVSEKELRNVISNQTKLLTFLTVIVFILIALLVITILKIEGMDMKLTEILLDLNKAKQQTQTIIEELIIDAHQEL